MGLWTMTYYNSASAKRSGGNKTRFVIGLHKNYIAMKELEQILGDQYPQQPWTKRYLSYFPQKKETFKFTTASAINLSVLVYLLLEISPTNRIDFQYDRYGIYWYNAP